MATLMYDRNTCSDVHGPLRVTEAKRVLEDAKKQDKTSELTDGSWLTLVISRMALSQIVEM